MAIYRPNFCTPNSTVDASSPINFTCTIQGTLADSYRLIIYDMSNVVKFDSGKTSLTTNLYQGDILSYTLNSGLTNGNEYTFTFTTYQGSLSATSRLTPFFCYSTPTLTMSVPSSLSTKSYTFSATYSQAQSIPLNNWTMTFLDSNGDIVLETSPSYSGLIQYNFDGFISGNTYSVYTTVLNQQNITVVSPTYTFSVSYSKPSLSVIPSATVLPDLSAIQINWSAPVVINGTVTGTYSYVNGLFNPNNTGLKLNSGSNIEYDLTIPEFFTVTVDYIPDSSFTSGIMVELDNSNGLYYQIGYNGTAYYFNNNGNIVTGTPKMFVYDTILIAIKGIEVLIFHNNQIYEHLYSQS